MNHISSGIIRLIAAFCVASSIHASAAHGSDAIDPKAKSLLDNSRSAVLKAKTFSVHMKHVEFMGGSGFKMEVESTVTLAVEPPKKIEIVTTMGDSQTRLISDGEHLFALSQGRYTQKPAPLNLRDVIEELEVDALFVPQEVRLVLSLFLADDFPNDFAQLAGCSIVGDEVLDEVPVTRLRLTLEPKATPPELENALIKTDPFVLSPDRSKMVVDLWIDRNERLLLRKFYSDATPFMQGRGANETKGNAFQDTITFNEWKLDEPIPPEQFAFTPPEGSWEVVSHISPGTQWPLVGNPPAAMDLPLLDGGRFNPSDHKGNILVIVFWRRAQDAELYWVKDVLKTAAEFADQGVRLSTINVGDSEQSIREFLAERGWKVPVALGRYETVPKDIAVSRVPYIIIVGKDGIVQGMHYMADRWTSNRLKAQLRWLIRGKSLLEDEPAREDK